MMTTTELQKYSEITIAGTAKEDFLQVKEIQLKLRMNEFQNGREPKNNFPSRC